MPYLGELAAPQAWGHDPDEDESAHSSAFGSPVERDLPDERRKELAAQRLQAAQRGSHNRHCVTRLREKRTAVTKLQKVQRGHSTRVIPTDAQAKGVKEGKPVPRGPIAVRVVMCGSHASGREEQAKWLAMHLSVPLVSAAELLQRDPPASPVDGFDGDEDERLFSLVCDELSSAACAKGWVLDDFPRSAAQARELEAISPPPTHWVLCSVDDRTAEARAAAAAAERGLPVAHEVRASREQLKRWKLRMIDVYSARPAPLFLRIDSANEPHDVHREIMADVLGRGLGRSTEALQTLAGATPAAARDSRRHQQTPGQQQGSYRTPTAWEAEQRTRGRARELSPRRTGSSPPAADREDAPAGEGFDEGEDGEDGAEAAGWDRRPSAGTAVSLQGFPWRGSSLLELLARFSWAFVRESVPIEGRLLLSVESCRFAAAVVPRLGPMSGPARLCCTASLVDARGGRLAGVDEVSTPTVRCAPGASAVTWRAELSLPLPRSVLIRTDVRVALTLHEESTRTTLLTSSRSLVSMLRQSIRAVPDERDRLDDDWPLMPPVVMPLEARDAPTVPAIPAIPFTPTATESVLYTSLPFTPDVRAVPATPSSPGTPAILASPAAPNPAAATAAAASAAIPPLHGSARVRLLVVDLVETFDEVRSLARLGDVATSLLRDELRSAEEEAAGAAAEMAWVREKAAMAVEETEKVAEAAIDAAKGDAKDAEKKAAKAEAELAAGNKKMEAAAEKRNAGATRAAGGVGRGRMPGVHAKARSHLLRVKNDVEFANVLEVAI